MSNSLNVVALSGRLARDVELRYTPNSQPVAEITLAVSEYKKNQDGSAGERTSWPRCTIWGARAEALAKYASKGDEITIEGKIRTDQWEDKETGAKRSKTYIWVRDFYFGRKKRGSQESGQDQSSSSGGGYTTGKQFDGPPEDDDIPF